MKTSWCEKKYRGTFRHVLVDEFQDTNPVQMEILKNLVGYLAMTRVTS